MSDNEDSQIQALDVSKLSGIKSIELISEIWVLSMFVPVIIMMGFGRGWIMLLLRVWHSDVNQVEPIMKADLYIVWNLHVHIMNSYIRLYKAVALYVIFFFSLEKNTCFFHHLHFTIAKFHQWEPPCFKCQWIYTLQFDCTKACRPTGLSTENSTLCSGTSQHWVVTVAKWLKPFCLCNSEFSFLCRLFALVTKE